MSSMGSLVQLVSRGFINSFSKGTTVLQASKNFTGNLLVTFKRLNAGQISFSI